MGWLDNLKGNMAIGIGPQGGQIAMAALQEKQREKRKKASEEELQRIEAIGKRVLALGRDGIAAVLTGQSTGNPQRDQVAARFKAQMDLRVKEGAYTQAEVNKGIRYALSLQTLVFDPIRDEANERINSGLSGIERGRKISGAQGNPLTQMSGTVLSKQLGGLPVGEAAEKVSQYYGGNPRIFSQLPFNEPTYGLATTPPPKPQGTFYQQDPSAWEEQQRKQAQIKQEYRPPQSTKSMWVYDTQLKKTIYIPVNLFDPERHEYPKTGGEGKSQYRSFNGQLIKINPDGSTQTVASPSEYTKAVKLAQSTDAWKLASTTEDRDQIIADMLPQAKRMKTNVNQPAGGGGIVKTKKLTPEIAAQYLKKYGTRQKAEEAARKDNYVW